jgi:hypothetical protein
MNKHMTRCNHVIVTYDLSATHRQRALSSFHFTFVLQLVSNRDRQVMEEAAAVTMDYINSMYLS